MKVRDLVKWLSEFEDQDAEVLVVEHHSGYYDQGGYVREESFDLDRHVDYIDLRSNQFIAEDSEIYGKRTLTLGAVDLP